MKTPSGLAGRHIGHVEEIKVTKYLHSPESLSIYTHITSKYVYKSCVASYYLVHLDTYRLLILDQVSFMVGFNQFNSLRALRLENPGRPHPITRDATVFAGLKP